MMENNDKISVETQIKASISKVWKTWNDPKDIIKWNPFSDEWSTSDPENKIKVGEKFLSILHPKEDSARLELKGTYEEVKEEELISYSMPDGRKTIIQFKEDGDTIKVTTTFDQEGDTSPEAQKKGWQSILDSFKKHVERE